MAIGLTLYMPGVLGRGAVTGLEDRQLLADVARAAKAQPAHHLRRQVRDDVAEHVGGHQHIIVLRVLQQPHADGIHVGIVHLDLREILVDFLGNIQEHAFGGAHHVGLVDDGHFLAAVLAGKLKRRPDDALGAFAGDDLVRDRQSRSAAHP